MLIAIIAGLFGFWVLYWLFAFWSLFFNIIALPMAFLAAVPALVFSVHRVGRVQTATFVTVASAACVLRGVGLFTYGSWEQSLEDVATLLALAITLTPILVLYDRWPISNEPAA